MATTAMNNSQDKFVFEGSELKLEILLVKGVASVIAAFAGWLCWQYRAADTDGAAVFIAVMFWIIAAVLLGGHCKYIDFSTRQIVSQTFFAGLQLWTEKIPLDHYEGIIVRHLCHEDESESFSANVGLKAAPNERPVWIKQFKATEAEIPADAWDFAQQLARRTGLPIRLPQTSSVQIIKKST